MFDRVHFAECFVPRAKTRTPQARQSPKPLAPFLRAWWERADEPVPATKPGQRTDLGKSVTGTKLAPSPRDPLYLETATTLPVDSHSFRRAFASALAQAGVNVQLRCTL